MAYRSSGEQKRAEAAIRAQNKINYAQREKTISSSPKQDLYINIDNINDKTDANVLVKDDNGNFTKANTLGGVSRANNSNNSTPVDLYVNLDDNIQSKDTTVTAIGGGQITQTTGGQLKSKPVDNGNTIKPTSTVSAAGNNVNEPPEKYSTGVASGLKGVAANLNPFSSQSKYGLIGSAGFGEFTKQTFYKPFEYVGKPKAYSEVGYNTAPIWRGTEFGYGMDQTQKNIYTPKGYGDTTKLTYFDITPVNNRAGIFEPQYYGVISKTGAAIETGALIGATAFGGSGATLAASYYIGAKTTSNVVNYESNYVFMTPTQKVVGGLGIAAGAVATIYTGNLAANKFYGEWLNLRYADLAAKPARISGQELLKTDEENVYRILAERNTGVGKAATGADVRVWATDETNIGYFTKGVTKTKVLNPKTDTYILTKESFTMGGNVPDIKTGLFKAGNKFNTEISYEGFSTGMGKGIYKGAGARQSSSFISGAKDGGSTYNIVSGSNPRYNEFLTNYGGGLKTVATTARGTYTGSGKIVKLVDQTPTYLGDDVTNIGLNNIKFGSPQTTYTGTITNLDKVGASTASASTSESQLFGISNAAKVSTKVSGISTVLNNPKVSTSIVNTKQAQDIKPVLASVSSTRLNTAVDTNTKTASAFAPPSISTGVISRNVPKGSTRTIPTTIEITKPGQTTKQTPKQSSTPRPPTFTPPRNIRPPRNTPGSNITPAIPKFSFGSFKKLGSNIVKGGKRAVGYIPSFSALVFKKFGSYKPGAFSKSGIDYRPITKGFKISKNRGVTLRL